MSQANQEKEKYNKVLRRKMIRIFLKLKILSNQISQLFTKVEKIFKTIPSLILLLNKLQNSNTQDHPLRRVKTQASINKSLKNK
jgi:hypothetical protein